MAVVMYVSKEVAEAKKFHNIVECNSYHDAGTIYLETTYIGCVVSLREMNGYDDSDFFAMVWDEAKGEFREVMYATTRGWTYPNSAKVDASPEVKEKYEAHLQAIQKARQERYRKEEAAAIRIGKRVEVFKGRKVAIGTLAEVFWVGPCKFNRNKVNAGIRLLNGDKVFVDSANLKVVDVIL